MEDINKQRLEQLRAQFGQICGNVITILEDFPESRNSYPVLIIEYWRRFNPSKWRDVVNGAAGVNLTSSETITRAARKIWEEHGLYLPNKKIKKERDLREKEMRELLSKDTEAFL